MTTKKFYLPIRQFYFNSYQWKNFSTSLFSFFDLSKYSVAIIGSVLALISGLIDYRDNAYFEATDGYFICFGVSEPAFYQAFFVPGSQVLQRRAGTQLDVVDVETLDQNKKSFMI